MIEEPMKFVPNLNYSSEDWNQLRSSLRDSLIAETPLSKLAKDMGMNWPINGKEEIPKKYISHSLEELSEMPEFFNMENRLALLYDILKEARQFDDPFADMSDAFSEVGTEMAEISLVLRKLEVPESYPVELINFTKRTRKICRDGGYKTLGQLLEFLQTSSTASIMNQEFGELIGYLVQSDIANLSKMLPIRIGMRGIFLAEAMGLIARRLMDDEAITLLQAYKISTTNPDWNSLDPLPKIAAMDLIEQTRKTALKFFEIMPEQEAELRTAIYAGMSTSVRYFVSLNDPDTESLAIAVSMAAFDKKPHFKGILGNLLS